MNSQFGILKRQNSIDILHHMENETPSYLKKTDFMTLMENEFIHTLTTNKQGKEELKDQPIAQWWLKHKKRNFYSGIDFQPGKSLKNGKYNLFQGFDVEPKGGMEQIPRFCELLDFVYR